MIRTRYEMIRELAEVEARHAEIYTDQMIDRGVFTTIYEEHAAQLLHSSNEELEEYYIAVFGSDDDRPR